MGKRKSKKIGKGRSKRDNQRLQEMKEDIKSWKQR